MRFFAGMQGRAPAQPLMARLKGKASLDVTVVPIRPEPGETELIALI